MSTSEIVREFAGRGFVVLVDCLAAADLAVANAAIDADVRQAAPPWGEPDEAGRSQSADILLRVPELDRLVTNSSLCAAIAACTDGRACLEEFSVMLRAPASAPDPKIAWHRDFLSDPDCPHGARAVSAIYYLTDVGPGDHCFTLIPGSHDQPDCDAATAPSVDIRGRAGTCVIFHTACLHAARLAVTPHARRTAHLYYGHHPNPLTSQHAHIPRRLAATAPPPILPHLYAHALK